MDVLAEVLATTRVGAAIYGRVELRAPFAMRFDRAQKAGFHVVERGRCVLALARRGDGPGGGARVELGEGDVVMLPRGWTHTLSDRGVATGAPYADVLAAQRGQRGGPPAAVIACGAYAFDHEAPHPLLAALPPCLHVPAASAPPALRSVVALLSAEIGSDEPGAPTAARRLLDVLFVHVLRAWLARPGATPGAGLGALRDPPTLRALAALHADPARAWSLPRLARAADVSRATLARRFTHHVGEAPLAYLRRWRMTLAAQALRETGLSVPEVAERVGYTSPVAFQKAFTRERQVTPAAYRRAQAPAPA